MNFYAGMLHAHYGAPHKSASESHPKQAGSEGHVSVLVCSLAKPSLSFFLETLKVLSR